MIRSEFQDFHRTKAKELTPFGAWLFTRVVIAMAGVLSIAPFVVYYWQNG